MSLEDILELTSSMKNDAVVYNYAADVDSSWVFLQQ